jgi:hypothetical protein
VPPSPERFVVVLCGLSIHLGRSGDDRRSFAAAASAIIFFASNVWLHSLAFLMLPLGVLRPRFDVLWLVPMALVVSVDDPSTWENDFCSGALVRS